MTHKRKRLTPAKAETAAHAIRNLLDRTDHDERLPIGRRNALLNTEDYLLRLANELREDEKKRR